MIQQQIKEISVLRELRVVVMNFKWDNCDFRQPCSVGHFHSQSRGKRKVIRVEVLQILA